jgi:hypothetical protein
MVTDSLLNKCELRRMLDNTDPPSLKFEPGTLQEMQPEAKRNNVIFRPHFRDFLEFSCVQRDLELQSNS